MKFCNSCKNIFDVPGTTFCPYCGSKSLKAFRISEVIPKEGIVLGFKYRRGHKFQVFYEEMKKIDTFYEIGGKKFKYCFVSTLQKDIQKLFPLITFSVPKEDCYFFENGKRLQTITCIRIIKDCIRNRNSFDPPELYCFGLSDSSYRKPNLVCCNRVDLEITPYSQIYDLGFWIDENTYKFDKEQLTKKVLANIRYFRLCPYINQHLINKFLELWPEIIDLNIDKRWVCKTLNGPLAPFIVISVFKSRKVPQVVDPSFFTDLIEKLYPEMGGIRALINSNNLAQ